MDRSQFPPGDLVLVNLPVSKRLNNLSSEKNQRSGFWPAKVTNKIKNSKVKREVAYYGTHEEAMVPLQSIVAYNQQTREKHISRSRENKDSVLAQALAKIEADFTAKTRTAEKLRLSRESSPITAVVKSAKLLEINQLDNTFMKLWNSYIDKSVGIIYGTSHLPRILSDFVNEHKEEMSRQVIYKDFLLHVCSLEEMGAISSFEMKNIVERLAGVSINWNKTAKRNYDGLQGSTASVPEDDSPGEVAQTSPDEVAETFSYEVAQTSTDKVAETSPDEVSETSADKMAQITDEIDGIPPVKILGGFHISPTAALFIDPIQSSSLTNNQTLNVINALSDHDLSADVENVSRGDEDTVEERVEECDNNNSNKTNKEVETSANIEEVEVLDAVNNVTGTAEDMETNGNIEEVEILDAINNVTGTVEVSKENPTNLDNEEVEMIEAIGSATFVMKVSGFTDLISAGVTKRKRPSEVVTANKKRLPGNSVNGGIGHGSNKPNKDCTNRICTGRRLIEDTVKIKMEIEMSEASFARVAHVLPSSFGLNLTQASTK